MANSFWNFVTQMVAGTLAKAEDVNTNLTGIESGMAIVETEINKAIQITNAAGTTDIGLNAAARANMIVSFDSSGGVTATTNIGTFKGDHADGAGTSYNERDVVSDAQGDLGLNNLYWCNTTHTSTGNILTDTANWTLLIDVTDVATSAAAALVSENAAAVSETNAAASYDSFDDRYLGPIASPPSVDNDGNALITGALYFNSASDLMYVRTSGATWELATASAVNVTVTDLGGHLAAADVEAALAEIAVLTKFLTVTGTTNELKDVEAAATADQTDAEIRTAVEAATDSNVFTDADHTKLNGIETAATADQSAAEVAVTDSGGFFAATDVEAAFAEIGASFIFTGDTVTWSQASTNTGVIQRGREDAGIALSGGTNINAGTNLIMYGATKTTYAYDFWLRRGSVSSPMLARFDDAAGAWTFATGAAGSLTLALTIDSSQNAAFAGSITSDGNIIFPAAANPSTNANTLDDYQEGTATPNLWDTSQSDAEGQTVTVVDADWTKVGRLVTFSLHVQVTGLGTLTTTQSAKISFGGMPASAAGSGTTVVSIMAFAQAAGNAGENMVGYIEAATSHIKLGVWDNAGGVTALTIAELGLNADIVLSGHYIA